MKVIVGNDHANIPFVMEMITHLKSKNFEVEHIGTKTDASVDYPDFGQKVATHVVQANDENVKGVLICGTGIGISIAANKVQGAICANCCDTQMASLAREHNNANILSLGGRMMDQETGKKIIDAFFSTDFAGERHAQRVHKMLQIK